MVRADVSGPVATSAPLAGGHGRHCRAHCRAHAPRPEAGPSLPLGDEDQSPANATLAQAGVRGRGISEGERLSHAQRELPGVHERRKLGQPPAIGEHLLDQHSGSAERWRGERARQGDEGAAYKLFILVGCDRDRANAPEPRFPGTSNCSRANFRDLVRSIGPQFIQGTFTSIVLRVIERRFG